MNLKKMILPALLTLSVFALTTVPALAEHHSGAEGKSCPISGSKAGCEKGSGCKGHGAMGGCGSCGSSHKGGMMKGHGCSHASSPCPIASKFFQKVCWLMQHKTELGLTDDQVAKIKSLDLEVEKNTIRGMAEMKIFALEMENRLSQSPIEVQTIESMIDSGMAGMATGAKASLKAYAELKSLLTDEQMAKAKELKTKGHAGHHHHKA